MRAAIRPPGACAPLRRPKWLPAILSNLPASMADPSPAQRKRAPQRGPIPLLAGGPGLSRAVLALALRAPALRSGDQNGSRPFCRTFQLRVLILHLHNENGPHKGARFRCWLGDQDCLGPSWPSPSGRLRSAPATKMAPGHFVEPSSFEWLILHLDNENGPHKGARFRCWLGDQDSNLG